MEDHRVNIFICSFSTQRTRYGKHNTLRVGYHIFIDNFVVSKGFEFITISNRLISILINCNKYFKIHQIGKICGGKCQQNNVLISNKSHGPGGASNNKRPDPQPVAQPPKSADVNSCIIFNNKVAYLIKHSANSEFTLPRRASRLRPAASFGYV